MEILIDEITSTLSDNDKKLVFLLNDNAVSIGYVPFSSRAGKKQGNYKIEYKRNKKSYVLFILRVSKGELQIGCKLLHLDKYSELIENLSDSLRNELLDSRPCRVDSGCTAYIKFYYKEKNYIICRHAMRLKRVTLNDYQSFWKLLAAEAECRVTLMKHQNDFSNVMIPIKVL